MHGWMCFRDLFLMLSSLAKEAHGNIIFARQYFNLIFVILIGVLPSHRKVLDLFYVMLS
jgi:hypothetical protein